MKLITNSNEQTYEVIKKLLLNCKSFKFNVAFISFGGYQILAQTFELVNKKNISGQILTTSYQEFTDPKVIRLIKENFNNFEIKVVDKKTIIDEKVKDSFHPKGYIFEFDDHYKVMIGSANITEKALKTNVEWSLLTILKKDDDLMQNINDEFNFLWDNTMDITNQFIQEYEHLYLKNKDKKQLTYSLKNKEEEKKIKPNSLQIQALNELKKLREKNASRALVIAATGVGKTYLSAFDVKQFSSSKTLFVVHRDEILRKSKETFENVLPEKSSLIFKGQNKNTNADIIFASKQTLENNLNLFRNNEFDYIIIDEAHHAAAPSYQKIINYFKPKFMLGMTATPDRMDGGNIWKIFEYNIAIDLRLKDAIEKELITTFHYFGITDLSTIDLSNIEITNLDKVAKELMINQRVDYIIQQINLYKYDGNKMHCIAFCINKEHAIYMSEEFNKRGIVSKYLISDLKDIERQEIIKKFEDENDELSVIFAIDILNEGVDIPNINMVLFLRPTDSPIIFLQQLGRGLRKNGNKNFLTVLDFIANHNKTYLIPYAFASYNNVINERYIYDSIKNDFKQYKNIHIEFDEISKDKIFKSISSVNFNSEKWIKWEYQEFKIIMKNQPILYMCDYLIEGAPDVIKIAKKYKSYLNFLAKMENRKEFFDLLQNEKFEFYINYLTSMLPLARVNEFAILFHCIKNELEKINFEEVKEIVNEFCEGTDNWSIEHSFKWFNCDYWNSDIDLEFKKFTKFRFFNLENKKYLLMSEDLKNVVRNKVMKNYLLDCIRFGIQRYLSDFQNYEYKFPFLKIGHKYSSIINALGINQSNKFNWLNRKGIFPIRNINYSNYLGYFIFITLNKEDAKKEWKFNDYIKSKEKIIWESPREVSQKSSMGENLINHKAKNIEINVFVRKNKCDYYTFIGTADVTSFHGNNPIIFELKLNSKLEDRIFYELK